MASVIGVGPWTTGEDTQGRNRQGSRRRGGRGHPGIAHILETDLIPRLLVAHGGSAGPVALAQSDVSAEEIAAFAPLAVRLEAHDLLAEVEIFMRRGLSVERVFVELLAPAARYLGEEWTADRLDFLDVTMALWRLQEVLREIAARSPSELCFRQQRSVLFSPFPGDQHSFGAAMIDECFTRAGWSSDLMIEPSRGSLLGRVANRSYDLVGLTVSCDCHIAQLPSLIVAVRNVSRNSDVRLILGGRVLVEDPDLANRAGADGTAGTALEALDLADRLLPATLSAAFA